MVILEDKFQIHVKDLGPGVLALFPCCKITPDIEERFSLNYMLEMASALERLYQNNPDVIATPNSLFSFTIGFVYNFVQNNKLALLENIIPVLRFCFAHLSTDKIEALAKNLSFLSNGIKDSDPSKSMNALGVVAVIVLLKPQIEETLRNYYADEKMDIANLNIKLKQVQLYNYIKVSKMMIRKLVQMMPLLWTFNSPAYSEKFRKKIILRSIIGAHDIESVLTPGSFDNLLNSLNVNRLSILAKPDIINELFLEHVFSNRNGESKLGAKLKNAVYAAWFRSLFQSCDSLEIVDYLQKGIQAWQVGNMRKAIQYCDRAILLNPKNAQAFLYRGKAKSNFSLVDAKSDLEKAKLLDPNLNIELHIQIKQTPLVGQLANDASLRTNTTLSVFNSNKNINDNRSEPFLKKRKRK